uniref:Zona pellucida protein AX 4 n=1 Tax=Sander lucioperca TaxID=283035 RepID=A0A8C9YLR4_SANLU
MAFGFCLSVTFLLSVWTTAKCDNIPNEGLHMECRDRYFMIAVELFFTGNEPSFEAVDETGVYPITEQYAAKCGYSVSVLPPLEHVELRASYFSCHTDNKEDEVFTFNFNLIVTHKGKEVTYALNKTCSPSLPWSPREVTCEVNYMEVSVRSDVACPTGTKEDDWDALFKTAYASATSDWQVMFQSVQQELMPISLKTAKKHGYAFDLTDGRLVFRAPYGQPDSFSTEVNGVPVEVVHATLFSRHSWVLIMVDLVAACSMHKGSYDNIGYIMWETPDVLHLLSGLQRMQVNIGVNGELVEQPVAEERGYIVKQHNSTVEISIPYNAEGGYRKSIVSGNLYEFYIFHLYLEQISMDEDHVDTRLRIHRTLATPLLTRPVFTENRTVPEERTFTVYLGDVPEDVELAAVHLNGQKFTVPFTNTSSHNITKVVSPNHTHGYTLKVPFEDPVVMQQLIKDATMQHRLDINYTLTVLPENEPFYQLASVMALTDASPPPFDAVCSESGISFKLDHQPIYYLWEISIGSELLTSELATKHGYVMSNNSQRLLLEVPLFTHGYKYKDITLKGFFSTFELLMRDHETLEVQNSIVKTCQFSATELIVCSADGRITVVADLPSVITSEGVPARTNLVDKNCGPKEMDSTRALFSFPINSCGSTVKLGKEYVTYENEIFFSKKLHAPANSSNDFDRVTMQCTYPLAGLLSVYRFESDAAGVGRIVHSAHSTQGLLSPTIKPTTVLQTPLSTQRGVSVQPAYRPSAQYIQVSSVPNNVTKNVSGFPGNVSVFPNNVTKNVSGFPNNVTKNISGFPGNVSGFPGNVSGFPNNVTKNVSGFPGNVSGFPNNVTKNISGFPGNVSGFPNNVTKNVSGFPGNISGFPGNASGFPNNVLEKVSIKPTTVLQTPESATRCTRRCLSMRPAFWPSAQYIKVSGFPNGVSKKGSIKPATILQTPESATRCTRRCLSMRPAFRPSAQYINVSGFPNDVSKEGSSILNDVSKKVSSFLNDLSKKVSDFLNEVSTTASCFLNDASRGTCLAYLKFG